MASIGEKIRSMIMVRTADPKKEPVRETLEANRTRNSFDADVLNYPNTVVLAAHNDERTLCYMPVQPVAMLESIGFTGPAGATESAEAVMELVKSAILLAYHGGQREVYFQASDEVTARGAKLMGFEELSCKVFRVKLPNGDAK